MSFRAIIIIALLGALSACGHLGTKSTNEPVATSPKITKTVVPSKVSAPADLATSRVDGPALSVVPEVDLLNRIRAGFQFPEFKSKHIHQYEKWSSQHPTYLTNLFTRAEPFLFHIVEEIEKRGLPMELVLLPAVESAYKPNAVSRSAAGGLWQFIPSTGKYYGLRQDWWYDGRRDTIAATNAALDYLTSLNQMFEGDWLLALAAYNAGQGTVRKAIKYNTRKGRPTNYQALNLRKETKRYVPKLFALINIIQDPDRFGVTLPVIENKPHFEIINLPGQIDLLQFAEQAEVELAPLQHLNAGFRRWATSPDGPHRLLVPLSSDMTKIAETLARIETGPKISLRNHRINKGDTLSAIARRYGVSVSALKTVNKMHSTSIREGRNLLIPVSDRTPDYIAKNSKNHIPKSVASAAYRENTAAVSNAQSIASSGSTQLVHRVVAGDTLWSIARQYQVRMTELLSWNKLRQNQILNLNQALLIFTPRG
ncbi:MAG: membrane-bound lytic murein transglycosylase D [Arenicella sp.]|jgi:membrane-bound lytic murein transglycosylase D